MGRVVPEQYRASFGYLFWDIAWYGLLGGSTITFLAIYLIRLGADPIQIGMLNAVPAISTLIFALPAGQFLARHRVGRAIFWSSAVSRVLYLVMIPLPLLLAPQAQISAYLWLSLLIFIPNTVVQVGFNDLFADTVPTQWRGYVAGGRNAATSLATVVTTLACGQILERVPFPTGYQIVFLIGFLGAAMSSLQLWKLRNQGAKRPAPAAAAAAAAPAGRGLFGGVGLRAWLRARQAGLGFPNRSFRRVLLLLFAFHLGQYLAIPVFPLFTVNVLHFSEQTISIGSGIFSGFVFLGSTQFSRLTRRVSNRVLLGVGIVVLSLYPILVALSHGPGLYLAASVIGGAGWAMVGSVLFNYLLEKVPDLNRSGYLAWYNVAFNAAVLIGSFAGPWLGGEIGLGTALLIFAGMRMLAGLAILRWG